MQADTAHANSQTPRDGAAVGEAQLHEMGRVLETHSAELGYLHGEYNVNVERVRHYYEPQLRPLRAVTYAAAEQQKLIEHVIGWCEKRTMIAESLRGTATGCAASDTAAPTAPSLRAVAAEMAKAARQEMLRSYDEFDRCTMDELKMLSQYTSPPDEAISTMQMVMLLRGDEDRSWAAAQVLVSYNYFTGFFRSRSETMLKTRDLLDRHTMCELEAFCARPEHAVAALYNSSTPIGCLGQWLHAVRTHFRVKLITVPYLLHAPTSDLVTEARATLRTLIYNPLTSHTRPLTECAPTTSAAVVMEEKADDSAADSDAAEYNALKEKLRMQLTRCDAREQETVYELRVRLHEVINSAHEAREQMAAIEDKIHMQVRDVQSRYDGTMLPIHDQLEEDTEQFLQLITHTAV